MKKMSRSPDRNTFQRDGYVKRSLADGKTLDDPGVKAMIKMYDDADEERLAQENDPAWQENNMEYDLLSTDWILEKVRGDDVYAQHLYAAICNNDFQKRDVWPILKNEKWTASWRYAGGIIADMQQKGDYIDWYCSGIRGGVNFNSIGDESEPTEEQKALQKQMEAYVGEGFVTDEIRDDLVKLGWNVVTDDDNSIY